MNTNQNRRQNGGNPSAKVKALVPYQARGPGGPASQPRQVPKKVLRGPRPMLGKGNGGKQPIVGAAAAYSAGLKTQAPRISASRDSCRIVHRELVASVTGSVAFTVAQSLALNPGLVATFPWLATQAQSWESYKFNKLRFCYYTRTGTNVPGSVLLVPDYDAADAAPASEQIASSYEDVVEDAPWKDLECNLREAAMFSMGPKKFIRTGALSANQDIKTYDVGNLHLCTVDGTAVAWGKLWVEYDISLYTPQLPPAGAGPLAALHITGVTPTSSSLLGTQTIVAGSTPFATVTGEVVTFSVAGRYMLSYWAVATTSVTQSAVPLAGAGGTIVTSYNTPTGYTNSGSGTAAYFNTLYFNAVVGSTLTYDSTIVLGLSAELYIAQVPSTQA